MSFSLTNTPISLKEYINKILAWKLDIFVSIYLEDILIYTNDDKDGYVAAVWWVLEQLKKFSLFANLKKCWFYWEEIWTLDYVVSSKAICTEQKKIEAVK